MPSVHVNGSEILGIMSEKFSYIQHKIGETARPGGIISSGACQPIQFEFNVVGLGACKIVQSLPAAPPSYVQSGFMPTELNTVQE